jgi:hypothetical protein
MFSIPNNKGRIVFLVQHFFGQVYPPTKLHITHNAMVSFFLPATNPYVPGYAERSVGCP